ncbi:thiol reductant ABC exporter subunit CydD [Planococcus halotolerans]|uniref:Thiol reductant ABC exporter subunit CydD n=1 Tax=Planococcus halotolerans TaxID=2233542 RepID=A0A365KRA0_9BACL|nr:thiol reductant ABC exporter subunit CydD [Planococcus halotolerans]QHJ69337.1 thiol reductant ABC exporter subunit CydD [Planococcus halotolerans]RAZ75682.1 thiol reductant ABC exporter subunit CydD [Planococcus halotolerans]
MKDLKQLAFEQKNSISLLIVMSVLRGAAMIGQAVFFVLVVDGVFIKDKDFGEITLFLFGLLLAIIVRSAAGYLIGRTGVDMAAAIKKQLRLKLINSFKEDPLLSSTESHSGQKVSLVLDAVDETDGFFSKYIPQLIQSYIIPIMLLAAIISQNWTTGLIILVTAPFIPVFMAIVGKRTKEKADEKMDQLNRFSGTFLDILQGLTTLRLFGQGEKQKDKIEESSKNFRDSTVDVLKSAFLSSLTLEYISMLSIGIIALEVGLRLVVFDNLSFFSAFLIMILVPDFFTMLKDFGSAFHTARGSVSAAQMMEEEFSKERKRVVWGETELAEGKVPHLSLENLHFAYNPQFELRDVSIDIEPYSKIAVIGKSGSGKTTLMHLIAGLLPIKEGDILIDGKPREEIEESSWFKQISYISQSPYLFAGTIKENIAIGADRETSQKEIDEAAEKAGISDLIASLPQGYETGVGEGGRGLSGGEKQRIALARAFLKKPTIILFDEPTTGLDLQTERILQQSIEELSRYATVITVAHRLHTIRNSDRIIFLENGKVAAAGTHEELAANFEPYRNRLPLPQGGASR